MSKTQTQTIETIKNAAEDLAAFAKWLPGKSRVAVASNISLARQAAQAALDAIEALELSS